jgi:hypothetical protein
MTIEKAREMSEWLLKILVPLFIAVCSFALESVRAEIKEMRVELSAIRSEYMAQIGRLALKVAVLEASQHDTSHGDKRAAD